MTRIWILGLVAAMLAVQLGGAQAQTTGPMQVTAVGTGTTWLYRGQLSRGGAPVSGLCDVTVGLWDSASGGAVVGTQTVTGVLVQSGWFELPLDYGETAFTGAPRWLEIAAQCAGDAVPVTLTPRQRLYPLPYSILAGSVDWAGVRNIPAGFADGVDDGATYVAGLGLTLTGNQFALSAPYRLPQACAPGQLPKLGASGWVCGSDDNTTYVAGIGLALTGTTFSVVTGTVQNIISQTITGGGGVVVSGTNISLSYTQIISNLLPIGTVIYTTGTCPVGLVVSPSLASERQVFDDYLLSSIGSAISSTANLMYADDLNTSGQGRPGARVADFADALVPPRQADFGDTWNISISNLFPGDTYAHSQESDGLRMVSTNPTSDHTSPPGSAQNLRYAFTRNVPGGGTSAFRWQGDMLIESCTSQTNATFSVGYRSEGGLRSNEVNIALPCFDSNARLFHVTGMGGAVTAVTDVFIAPFAVGTWYAVRIDYSGGTFTYCLNSTCSSYTPGGVFAVENVDVVRLGTSIDGLPGQNLAVRFRNTAMRWATSGTLTSDLITRSTGERWGRLTFERATPSGTAATVDVLNGATGAVLLTNVSSGVDLSAITATSIRLRGNLSRPDYNAQSPTLYRWSVTTRDALVACVR